ncbi:MAG: flagellar hook-basal body complex protein FliE [Pseudomonadota bacterium]
MKIEPIIAQELYGSARKATGLGQAEGPDFADALESALADMHQTLAKGERVAAEAMAGDSDVQSVVEALTATEMALETAVVVRDRVVEAYQEILRMPV